AGLRRPLATTFPAMTGSASSIGADAAGTTPVAVTRDQRPSNGAATSTTRTTRREWAIVLAACASPLLMLFGSRDWLLTPVFYIDPWAYVAFFDHYGNPRYLAGHYKLARLPWILAGWVVHHVIPGVTGAYVLHAIFLVAGGFAFFILLRALFGRFRIALLG